MHAFIHKIATALLASVILSASCLLCLVPATPVSAASLSVSEIQAEQHQNCEKRQSTSFAQERSTHPMQDPACDHAHDQANITNVPPPWTDRHPLVHDIFTIHHIVKLDALLFLDPSYRPSTIDHLLTGTTIKRE